MNELDFHYWSHGYYHHSFVLQVFGVIDSYLRLILTSWPAVVLIILVLILFRHRDVVDEKLRTMTKLGTRGAEWGPPGSRPASPSQSLSSSPSPSVSPSPSEESLPEEESIKTPLVSYKIASELPNSVIFNFAEVYKVWFWIYNYDPIKYLVYIKIKFIFNNFEKESESEYYGGLKAWKLNGYSGIQAPGLGFPEEIKNAVKQGQVVKIEIRCKIHNELDEFIEEKFPQTYAYNSSGNYWFLEP